MFTIIATDENGLRIEFDQNEKELQFESYEEAQKFIDSIKTSNMFPEKYRFVIEEKPSSNDTTN
ncbi:hypothetical protein [Halobacillus naozhouensis]|uniref:YhzD-like protein n=1 Tax=Halobacillus naozhouensis TaxID=554880 RepID=A0ABY8J3N1_9BACI|nr:hypothetical protein [Halobacillus naozhouensis]WFT75471.1 hypothetical protein P9989_03470 [Halobacillus naozhouensis]